MKHLQDKPEADSRLVNDIGDSDDPSGGQLR